MILRICQYGAAYFARRFFAFVRRAADGGCLTAAGGSPGVGARHIAEGAGGAGCALSRGARRDGEAAAFWGARRLWLNFRAWLTIAAGSMNFAALKGACL